MTDFVRTVIIMSVTGSIISLFLFILKPLVRNRLLKSTQYYLWLVAIFAMLIPISQIVILTDNQATTVPALQRVAPIPAIQQAMPIPTISETVSRFVITQNEEQARLQNIAHLAHTNESAYQSQRQEIISPMARFTTYFVRVYPFGVLIVTVWYVANYLFFSKMYRRRNLLPGAEATQMLAEMCNRRPPQLYYNQLASTPMILGVFRPAIILPDKYYSPEQLYAILSHELTHLRRKDIFVKWLTLLATALHWFNPIVWLTRREIDRSCELSCDEAVIRNLDTDGKQIYGNTLIAVSANSKAPRAIASATMCEDKKNLKERLNAIMKNKRQTRIAILLSAMLLFLTACGAVMLGVGSAENETPASEPAYTVPEDPMEEPTENEYPAITDPVPAIANINITRRSDYLLGTFPTLYQMDFLEQYAELRGLDDDHHLFDIQGDWGVVVWSDVTLRDLQVILVRHELDEDGADTTYVDLVLYELAELPPNTPFVINRFFTVGGVFPWEGISFVDPTGTQRYFLIADDRRGEPEDPPYFFLEFENGGQMWSVRTPFSAFPIELEDGPLWVMSVDLNLQRQPQQIATALNWIVEPALPHEHIIDCPCGEFLIYVPDQGLFVLDRATGQQLDWAHGHGGGFSVWVYDPERNLFGHTLTWRRGGEHWLIYGMHPMDEWDDVIRTAFDFGFSDESGLVSERFIERSNRVIVVEKVDSSMISRFLEPDEMFYSGTANEMSFVLYPEAASGRFAFMYDRQLITDFIFDEAIQMRDQPGLDTAYRFPLISVRIGDRWGLVDRYGNVRLDFMFDHLLIIDENTAFAKYNGAYGILDIQGM